MSLQDRLEDLYAYVLGYLPGVMLSGGVIAFVKEFYLFSVVFVGYSVLLVWALSHPEKVKGLQESVNNSS